MRPLGIRHSSTALLGVVVSVLLSLMPATASYGKALLRPSVGNANTQGIAPGAAVGPRATRGDGLDWGGTRQPARRCSYTHKCPVPVPSGVPDAWVFATAYDKPAISADGDLVAFTSDAINFSTQDQNNATDVFVHEAFANTTALVSVSYSGVIGSNVIVKALEGRFDEPAPSGNGASEHPSMSESGRYIAFESDASDLVPSDSNGKKDVFVRDMALGRTVLISKTTRGSPANGPSGAPSISANGRFIAYESYASNILENDPSKDPNGAADVFVYDRDDDGNGVFDEPASTRTELMSRMCTEVCPTGQTGNGGSYAPSISADGSTVAFESDATDFTTDRAFNRDIFILAGFGLPRLVSDGVGAGQAVAAAVSADGNSVAFETTAALAGGDTDSQSDIYLWDAPYGALSYPFGMRNGPSYAPSWDYFGDALAFSSGATDFGPTDTNSRLDVYEYSWAYGQFFLKSVSNAGAQGDGSSILPAFAGYGGAIAFSSDATNLITDDTNGTNDIFEHRSEDCAGERPENGPVSRPIYEQVLPKVANWEPLLHRANCEFIAGNGL